MYKSKWLKIKIKNYDFLVVSLYNLSFKSIKIFKLICFQ